MRALSMREPWLSAVLEPSIAKGIENRRWPTKYRGLIWLHAAIGMTAREYDDAADWMRRIGVEPPRRGELRCGLGVCGRAQIVDMIPPGETILKMLLPAHVKRWHMPEQYGFVLSNVERLRKPVPCRGSLGLFALPSDVEAAALAALEV